MRGVGAISEMEVTCRDGSGVEPKTLTTAAWVSNGDTISVAEAYGGIGVDSSRT